MDNFAVRNDGQKYSFRTVSCPVLRGHRVRDSKKAVGLSSLTAFRGCLLSQAGEKKAVGLRPRLLVTCPYRVLLGGDQAAGAMRQGESSSATPEPKTRVLNVDEGNHVIHLRRTPFFSVPGRHSVSAQPMKE
jgi:hypothetical protein